MNTPKIPMLSQMPACPGLRVAFASLSGASPESTLSGVWAVTQVHAES